VETARKQTREKDAEQDEKALELAKAKYDFKSKY
jgi:hypothetical protein